MRWRMPEAASYVAVWEIADKHTGHRMGGPEGIEIPAECTDPEAFALVAADDYAELHNIDRWRLNVRKRHKFRPRKGTDILGSSNKESQD
jgi:hypothetical protein